MKLVEFWHCRGTKTASLFDIEVERTPSKHIGFEYALTMKSGQNSDFQENDPASQEMVKDRQGIPYIRVADSGDNYEITHYKWDHSARAMVVDRTYLMGISEAEDLRLVLNVRARQYLKDREAQREYVPFKGKAPLLSDWLNSPRNTKSNKAEMLDLIKKLAEEVQRRPNPVDAYIQATARPQKPAGWKPDGDDNNAITKYAGPELCAGDSMKVILKQMMDLVFIDGLQKHEVLALVEASLDEHVVETDDNE